MRLTIAVNNLECITIIDICALVGSLPSKDSICCTGIHLTPSTFIKACVLRCVFYVEVLLRLYRWM